MKFILGKKLEMTQIFQEDGKVAPVTKILAGPCSVTAKKTSEKHGYSAIQISNKQMKKAREFRMDATDAVYEKLKPGQMIDAGIFSAGDVVKVTGTSKGKGFQGVVRRHGFHGAPASHGHKDQLRMPGSIGATGPAHVFKGKKMPGHMGNERVTMEGLEVIQVDAKNNFLYVKGAVPGARNGLLMIKGEGDFDIKKEEKKVVEKTEEKVTDKVPPLRSASSGRDDK